MALLPLFLLAVALSASGNIISPNQRIQPYLIRLRIELLTTTLQERCPQLLDHDKFLGKRDIDSYDDFLKAQNYALEMKIYNHVQALHKQCYDQLKVTRPRPTSTTTTPTTSTTTKPTTTTSTPTTSTSTLSTSTRTPTTTTTTPTTTTTTPTTTSTTPTTTTTTPTTATTTPTTTSTTPTTTTGIPLPSQCTSSATLNLTESWRKDSPKTSPLNNDIKILKPGETWFRFSGAAGNLLKNTCPGEFSCGSSGAYWSDSPLPTQVGETVSITFYESYYSGPGDEADCKDNGRSRGRATRCSADRGGLVYIMDVPVNSEDDTVCGMD